MCPLLYRSPLGPRLCGLRLSISVCVAVVVHLLLLILTLGRVFVFVCVFVRHVLCAAVRVLWCGVCE